MEQSYLLPNERKVLTVHNVTWTGAVSAIIGRLLFDWARKQDVRTADITIFALIIIVVAFVITSVILRNSKT